MVVGPAVVGREREGKGGRLVVGSVQWRREEVGGMNRRKVRVGRRGEATPAGGAFKWWWPEKNKREGRRGDREEVGWLGSGGWSVPGQAVWTA